MLRADLSPHTAAVAVDTDAFERLVETFRGGSSKLVKHVLRETGVRRFRRS